MNRRLSSVLGALLLLAPLSAPVTAQEASPGLDRSAFVPSPEECVIEPRTAESL
jgi:hypothetical protein